MLLTKMTGVVWNQVFHYVQTYENICICGWKTQVVITIIHTMKIKFSHNGYQLLEITCFGIKPIFLQSHVISKFNIYVTNYIKDSKISYYR